MVETTIIPSSTYPSPQTGLMYPRGITISGDTLYVTNYATFTTTTYVPPSGDFPGFYETSTNTLNAGSVSQYNINGYTNNGLFISSGLSYPAGIAISGNNLYIVNVNTGTIGVYNAYSGSVINADFIGGLNSPFGIAISDDGTTLYVANGGNNTIGVYDVTGTTSVTINANFITGLDNPHGIAISGNYLYVSNYNSGTIGVYNVSDTTSVTINANFITGLNGPYDIAISDNYLYVANYNSGTIGVYNVSDTTSVTINANFITGLDNPTGIAIGGNYLYVSCADITAVYVDQYSSEGSIVQYSIYKHGTGSDVTTPPQSTVAATYTLTSSGRDANGNVVTATSSFTASASGDSTESATNSLHDHAHKIFLLPNTKKFSRKYRNTTHNYSIIHSE